METTNPIRPWRAEIASWVVTPIGQIVFVALFLLSLPLILPFVSFGAWKRSKRQTKRIAQTICVSCGQQLGIEAERIADEKWLKAMQENRKNNPGIRSRIYQLVHAICQNCGAEYRYLEDDDALVIAEAHTTTYP